MLVPPSDSHKAILNIGACIGCGECIEICPTKAIPELIGLFSHLLEINRSKCNGCGDCVSICPHEAIVISYSY
jgi:ferredoxin